MFETYNETEVQRNLQSDDKESISLLDLEKSDNKEKPAGGDKEADREKKREKAAEEAVEKITKQIGDNNAKLDKLTTAVLIENAYQQEVEKSNHTRNDLRDIGYSFYMQYKPLSDLYNAVKTPADLDKWLNDPKNNESRKALESNPKWGELKSTLLKLLKTEETLDKFDQQMKENPGLGAEFNEVRKLKAENARLEFEKVYEKATVSKEITDEFIDSLRNLAGRKRDEVLKALEERLGKDSVSVKYENGNIQISRYWKYPGDPNHTGYSVTIEVPIDKNKKVSMHSDVGGPYVRHEQTAIDRKEAAKLLFGKLPSFDDWIKSSEKIEK